MGYANLGQEDATRVTQHDNQICPFVFGARVLALNERGSFDVT
jgi:hypothetical protein